MKSEVYDDMALEENLKKQFGFSCDIDRVIVRDIPVSHMSQATVFFTKKKDLMVFISGKSRLTLADIKTITARMGIVADSFLPPDADEDYFNNIAREKFVMVFPGRTHLNDSDLAYYRTLAPYQPALVRVSHVKSGEINQFDTDSSSGWRVATKLSYRRIPTI